jgi:hypothetical protein
MGCADCDLSERCRCVRLREQKASVGAPAKCAETIVDATSPLSPLLRTPNLALLFALRPKPDRPKDPGEI